MLQHDFENSPGYWITLVAQALQRALNEELAPQGITFRQAQILGWLALEGDQAQVDLAAKMMIEPPTLVRILDRMERDGWISRSSCEFDRRKKIIRANATAEIAWKQIMRCVRKVRLQAFAGLSNSEQESLMRSLRKVHKNLSPISSPMEESA